ncbi:MAG: hypothetical protein WA790_04725 [Sulfitobacter sp.]
MARSPIFLERHGYRLRRMRDAVLFLPLLGLALWMVPLMWPAQGDTNPMPLSTALQYIFGIWIFLVLSVWALWRRTRDLPSNALDDVARQSEAE